MRRGVYVRISVSMNDEIAAFQHEYMRRNGRSISVLEATMLMRDGMVNVDFTPMMRRRPRRR